MRGVKKVYFSKSAGIVKCSLNSSKEVAATAIPN